jgi:hypothetical protein
VANRSLRQGRYNGTLQEPKMSLPFLVMHARPTYTPTGGIDPKAAWVFFKQPLRCDAYPMSDALIFLQAGVQNPSTIIFHFYYSQDVQVHDRVQLLRVSPIVGDVGSWFEMQAIEKPYTNMSYLRAHGHVITPPPGATLFEKQFAKL